MGIYQKLKFLIGKVTVIIMAVIFPFAVIAQNRKVSSAFCNIFIALALLVLLCAVINKLINSKDGFKDIITTGIKSRCVVPGILILLSVVWCFISPAAGYEFSGTGSIIQGMLLFIGCTCIYIVISACYLYEETDMMIMIAASVIINIITILRFLISAKYCTDAYCMYTVMMFAVCVYAFLLSDDNKKIYYLTAAGLCEMGLISATGNMAVTGMVIVLLVMQPIALRKYECFTRYELIVLMIFILGRLFAYINVFTNKVIALSASSAFLTSYKTTAFIIAGCIIYMMLIIFDDRVKGCIKNIRKVVLNRIYMCITGLDIIVIITIVMINNYRNNYTFYLMIFIGIIQILMSAAVFIFATHNVLESIEDRTKPEKDISNSNDDSLLQGYGSRYMITAIGMAVIAYILQGTGNLFKFEVFPVFICFAAIMSTYNKNCGS